jgi:hypothetical protein
MTKTWKAIERKVASFFGSKRTPLSGGNSGHSRSDSLHPVLFIETKYRKKHSAVQLWRKTAVLADLESKKPVVALAEKGSRGFWLVVHSSDLMAVANQRLLAMRKAELHGTEICDGDKGECSGDCDNCEHHKH